MAKYTGNSSIKWHIIFRVTPDRSGSYFCIIVKERDGDKILKRQKTRKKTKDSPQRSILKTISWRVLATTATMIIIYVISGSLDWAIMGGIFDVVVKLVLYYAHERLWTNIEWGKSWRRRAWRRHYRKMHKMQVK